MSAIARIGVLTGGGDAPGLNAVIRAVVLASAAAGMECVGLEDSFDGLASPARAHVLAPDDVRDIIRRGGTVLGTTNEGSPFAESSGLSSEAREMYSARCLEGFRSLGLGALVVIGGDGTLGIGYELHRRGMPIVGVPKTIDNDIPETSVTFGFDTAVAVAAEAIDRVRASAESHHRIMLVEVMGHDSGWLALSAALASGADAALIPEIRFDLTRVRDHILARERRGIRHSIIVIADEARAASDESMDEPSGTLARLRSIGERVAVVLGRLTGKAARHVVLGHVQRGGEPSAADRVLATRFGSFAVDLVERRQFGVMTAVEGNMLVAVPLERVVGRTRGLSLDSDLVQAARRTGMCLGD